MATCVFAAAGFVSPEQGSLDQVGRSHAAGLFSAAVGVAFLGDQFLGAAFTGVGLRPDSLGIHSSSGGTAAEIAASFVVSVTVAFLVAGTVRRRRVATWSLLGLGGVMVAYYLFALCCRNAEQHRIADEIGATQFPLNCTWLVVAFAAWSVATFSLVCVVLTAREEPVQS